MKITDLLSEKTISIDVKAASKEDVIKQAVALIGKSGVIKDLPDYEKGVFAREEESTTGIGEGIAIPHCKNDVVSAPALAAMVIPEGVDYASLDGEPVHLLFLIAAPNSEDNVHLDVLARLSEMLMNDEFKNKLLAAKSKKEFLKVIDDAESEKLEESEETEKYPRVLAVTACPTGIAHTYMAEQALKDKAKEMGISIKVETNGSGGAKNILTDDEINHAEGIIVAADTNVEVDRFAGKRLVQVPVAKGIHEPEKLINQALSEETPVFKPGESRKTSNSDTNLSIGRRAYKHLMNGVSHMLPFVIGGGILIAIAFLIDTCCGNAGKADFGSVNEVAYWFKQLGGYAFGFMVWVLAGFIAHSIAGRPGLAVGMVGGFLATQSNFNITYTISRLTAVAAPGEDAGTAINRVYADLLSIKPDATGITSGFLGGIVAGFLAGAIVLLLAKAFKFLPKSLESLKPTLIYPIFGILLIGVAMFLINTPLIYVNMGFSKGLNWLGDHDLLILVCLLVAAMMAIDMGGPINKAAYVFGCAMLESAQKGTVGANGYIIMAAVMAGGMVPPLAIALASTLFPQKFTKNERKEALVNYIMGASFITEGAIPFAAADPLRVIVSCATGSAVSGILVGAFHCTLMAPHGGIFVVATIGSSTMYDWAGILLYIASIVAGAVVGAFMLGIWKKNAENPELGKWKGLKISFKKAKQENK